MNGVHSAPTLLIESGLVPNGPSFWGEHIPSDRPGVYVIEAEAPLPVAPIDKQLVHAWIARVPTLLLDGRRPSTDDLVARLAGFWIANDLVLYVGRTSKSLAKRVGDFYRTPLGDPRPHAGGHWLKTLDGLGALRVWWAATDDPSVFENTLLTTFARRHGGGLVLPFANRQTAAGVRKVHGITGSTLSGAYTSQIARLRPANRGPRPSAKRSRIEAINAALQRIACAEPGGQIRAVDAARELDRLGLLNDSDSRPGLPLRILLRDGLIEHAHQEAGRRWLVRCVKAGARHGDPAP